MKFSPSSSMPIIYDMLGFDHGAERNSMGDTDTIDEKKNMINNEADSDIKVTMPAGVKSYRGIVLERPDSSEKWKGGRV